MLQLPPALAPMGAYRQFIVVKLVPSTKKPGKHEKFPVDYRTGAVVNAHDPAIWLDAATACATAAAWGMGYAVGFVFTATDPFWFLDIDSCYDGNGWSPLAHELCAMFPGAAIEVSTSGVGLHVFGCGTVPAHSSRADQGLEFYTSGRFVLLTGTQAQGNAATDHTAAVTALVARFFPPREAVAPAAWTDGPCEGWNGPTDDDELLRRAMQSHSARSTFGGAATFADLFLADAEKLGRAYPDDDRPWDESKADAALAKHLAFWTGHDAARIERLMRRSGLARAKWDQHASYMALTIGGAIGMGGDVLRDKLPEASPLPSATASAAPVAAVQRAVTGSTYLSAEQQVELFKGCVYVSSVDRVLVPGGRLLRQSQFKTIFGGYSFVMDAANGKLSRDAWEAFTQSQVLRAPIADETTFRPDLAPGVIVEAGGVRQVNAWWPVDTPRRAGDPTPFLAHVEKLLPDATDRKYLLSYLAAMVRYPGKKFMWAPLIQGVEGNGKTILSLVIAKALGRYAYWPAAERLKSNFNGWLLNRCAYLIEDIHITGAEWALLEKLKPMITATEAYEIEGKGIDTVNARIVGNFIFNSNHKDGLPKTMNDRRVAPFYCAQQAEDDLARDGMGPAYFQRLYGWLEGQDGYAIVAEYLATLPIEDAFNPALGGRAPNTTSTALAKAASRSSIEQEVVEAIEQGTVGFGGPWVSSIFLGKLLEKAGKAQALSYQRRRDMLGAMGYVPHPALPDGRVHNAVMPDGGKPRLFVRRDAQEFLIGDPPAVAKAYSQAQGVSPGK